MIQITRISSYDEFLNLEKEWTNLLESCNNSIFSTWEWLSTWWKHFGNDKELLILIAEKKGEIIGIAPLMYSVHKLFGLRRGQIEFIGTPHTDYNNFILTQQKQECLKLFFDYIYGLSENWECISLSDIPENAECLPFIRKVSTTLKPFYQCPYLPLPHSIDELLRRLSRKRRKNLRRQRRKLKADFTVELTDLSQPHSWTSGFNHLVELHQKRWMSVGFSGAFSDKKFRNFTRDIAEIFSRKKWLGLYLFKLSGVPVAAEYGFIYNSIFHSYLPGFDPSYGKYGVGNMLMLYQLERDIENGLFGYDFLRGGEEYKNSWHPIIRWNRKAVLTRKGFAARIQHKLYNEYWYQGTRIQYVLKLKE